MTTKRRSRPSTRTAPTSSIIKGAGASRPRVAAVRRSSGRDQRQLRRAPVREAVIDFQFAAAISTADLDRYAEGLRDEFDQVAPLWRTQLGVRIGADGAEPRSETQVARQGLRLQSSKQPYVFQCRVNGFTLSRLSPYESWHELVEAARRYWDQLKPAMTFQDSAEIVNLFAVVQTGAATQPHPVGRIWRAWHDFFLPRNRLAHAVTRQSPKE